VRGSEQQEQNETDDQAGIDQGNRNGQAF
jgi:hypothetical protein